jgi:GAF domain
MVSWPIPAAGIEGIGVEPTRLRGAVGPDRHPRAIVVPGLLTGFASSATGRKGTLMPIDLAVLAKSIGTLTGQDPQQDLAATLRQAVRAAKQLVDADAAGVMLADADGRLRWASASDQRAQSLEDNQEVFAAGPCAEAFTSGWPAAMHDAGVEQRWGEVALVFVEVQIRSGLSVPVQLGGGPIGTLDVYAVDPRAWTTLRSAPCRPLPGWWPACSGRPPRRAHRCPGPAAPSRGGLPGADRAGQGRADGTRAPGCAGGVHPPAPGGQVIGTKAVGGGRRGRRRPAPPRGRTRPPETPVKPTRGDTGTPKPDA